MVVVSGAEEATGKASNRPADVGVGLTLEEGFEGVGLVKRAVRSMGLLKEDAVVVVVVVVLSDASNVAMSGRAVGLLGLLAMKASRVKAMGGV